MATEIFDSLGRLLLAKDEAELTTEPVTEIRLESGGVFRVEQIRRGGMGIVYIGQLEGAFGEPTRCALKTFHEKFFLDPFIAQAAQREHTFWVQLADLPFVFPVAGALQIDKKPHLIMPVAEADGEGCSSIADVLRRQRQGLRLEQCLFVGLCLAIAMRSAAERIQGLVHGDIKPGNLLFLHGFPMLSDFGLADIAERAGRRGTPAYMAPELWLANGTQSAASDVYAYGSTLAELLLGRPPFEASPGDMTAWATLHARAPATIRRARPGEDAELAANLVALASRCLAKASADRPSFEDLSRETARLAMRFAPEVLQRVVVAGGHLIRERDSHAAQFATFRVRELLRAGEPKAAIQMLERIPEQELVGELLLVAGSAWSLAGNDERALEYFERYLRSEPEEKARANCMSEIGLSLRRLGRLEEAEKVFFDLLPLTVDHPDLEDRMRGNYAAVLLDRGKSAEAIGQLEALIRKGACSPLARALHAQALLDTGRPGEAVRSIDAAVRSEPRNGQFHVIRADALFRQRRLSAALESLDLAYGFGHHSRDWLVLTLATYTALGRREAACELLEQVEEQLPEGGVEQVEAEVFARVRSMDGEGSPSEEEPENTTGARSDTPSAMPSEPTDWEVLEPARPGPDPVEREGAAAADRERLRSGRQPHIQTRVSSVDSSVMFDFYFGTEQEEYVEVFRGAYAQMKSRVAAIFPYEERQGRFRFARCQHCAFLILTARDEGEQIRCQVCEERRPVVTAHGARLDELATDCERAIGRSAPAPRRGESCSLIAFWAEPTMLVEITACMADAGYARAAHESAAGQIVLHEVQQRGVRVAGPPDLMFHRALRQEESSSGKNTPPALERLLRGLRRRLGHFQSVSLELPQQLASYMVAGEAERLSILRAQAAESPFNREIHAVLVSAEIDAGNLDRASRLASVLETAEPNDALALVATAQVAFARGDARLAASKLERVLAMHPRNQKARALVVHIYGELGDERRAAEHYAKLEALGGWSPGLI